MSILKSRRLALAVVFCLTLSWGVCTPVFYTRNEAFATCPYGKHSARKTCENTGGEFKGLLMAGLVIAVMLLLMRKSSDKTQNGLGDAGEDYIEEDYYTLYDLADYCDPLDDDDDDKKPSGGDTTDANGKTPVGQTDYTDLDGAGKTYSDVTRTFFENTSKDTVKQSEVLVKRRNLLTRRAAEGIANGLYVQNAGVAALRAQNKNAKAITRAPNLIGISRQNTASEQQNLYALGNMMTASTTSLRMLANRAVDIVETTETKSQTDTTGGK